MLSDNKCKTFSKAYYGRIRYRIKFSITLSSCIFVVSATLKVLWYSKSINLSKFVKIANYCFMQLHPYLLTDILKKYADRSRRYLLNSANHDFQPHLVSEIQPRKLGKINLSFPPWNISLSDDKTNNFLKQALIYSITELNSLQLYLNASLSYPQP